MSLSKDPSHPGPFLHNLQIEGSVPLDGMLAGSVTNIELVQVAISQQFYFAITVSSLSQFLIIKRQLVSQKST